MSENKKSPDKGILKKSKNFDKQHSQPSADSKETEWDETNIIKRHPPTGKDVYQIDSKMKSTADESSIVFVPGLYDEDGEDTQVGVMECEQFELNRKSHYNEFHALQLTRKLLEEDDYDEDEQPHDENNMKREEFELKRKNHYNEFYTLQLARKLIQEEEDDDDDDDENDGASSNTNSEDKTSCI
ncbi:unnamed protein product [Ceutorhynchus assimilis]|uniref:Protein phosphatase inhibitor 2 n=1 Tax=Ceutorhynchus assimilis TaxID=467358 RepID=A0A9N9MTT5_9CUCU|nr:unnamed protein product [Ceutorhynchus assimilis]